MPSNAPISTVSILPEPSEVTIPAGFGAVAGAKQHDSRQPPEQKLLERFAGFFLDMDGIADTIR